MSPRKENAIYTLPSSYWIESMTQKGYPTLQNDMKVDIAIIGGGISGISAAYLLSQQGIKVAVIEAREILQSTTGHTTAKITSQHGLIYHKIINQLSKELAEQYAAANETAIHMIKKLAKENQIECDYTPQSAYIYTLQDKYIEKIQEEVKAAESLGIQASYLDKIPLDYPVKAAIRFDGQAQFHPRKFLIPLAEKIIKNGGQIYEHSRITNLEEKDTLTLITNQNKKIQADKIIIASHYPCLNKSGFYFSKIYSERSYVIALKAKQQYPGGMYITAEDPGRSLRNQKTKNGDLILISGEHHKTGQGEDTSLHYEKLIDFANKLYTVEDIPYHWSTEDCMTLDNLPYVGQLTSKNPNIYVTTGFGKWGMTNSIASAILLKSLILDGKSPWEDVYSPTRKISASSIGTFISQNSNVAKNFVEGKLSSKQKDIQLEIEEGRIIDWEGQKIGVYKDRQGKLHIVDTTCTHMGCELKWNSAEKTWDCPCHGSRFTYDGDILKGPAVDSISVQKDIDKIKDFLDKEGLL
ncbi:FAD-dependent oxidoreductase [Anaerosacchariphilus polymeriproducens]|uniref:FAD-dependent oxidoreductase n=1 Tax=Anaerosacchariphilus polymeriproducens TaxID=1812858 RepID=A0A371AZJ0_9FIRM|nr:FAD-dependent oxidoreductase [Anaerosacchariphilus polymeriproducens]RDU25028.1 FAD-dependent oxidoreductase [Anaerosacchariphilus polymeriproducens]